MANYNLRSALQSGSIHRIDASRAESVCAELDAECHDERGQLLVVPASTYARFSQNDLTLWCVMRGYYCLPTTELLELLAELSVGRTIEIGSGNGCIGRALGVVATDSYQQQEPAIVEIYNRMGQKTVDYGADVEKLDARSAVEKYQPETVVAAWVTHLYRLRRHAAGGNEAGIDEGAMLDSPSVRRYVHVGHQRVHQHKEILGRPHQTHLAPWLYGRALDPEKLVVWVW